MEKITISERLEVAIAAAKLRQQQQRNAVNVQFENMVDGLKPINILNNTLTDFQQMPNVKANVIGSVVSIASGYLTRKLVTSSSSNLLTKIGGYALQYMITNFVSKKIN